MLSVTPRKTELNVQQVPAASVFLYRGTDIVKGQKMVVEGIDIHAAGGDMGLGFYVTPAAWEAIEWAQRVSNHTGNRPVIVRLRVDSLAFAQLRSYEFSDENELYQFVRETGRGYQRRLLDYDCLISKVILPTSRRVGVQIKFQTERAEKLLNSCDRKLLLFPLRWTTKDFLTGDLLKAFIAKRS